MAKLLKQTLSDLAINPKQKIYRKVGSTGKLKFHPAAIFFYTILTFQFSSNYLFTSPLFFQKGNSEKSENLKKN